MATARDPNGVNSDDAGVGLVRADSSVSIEPESLTPDENQQAIQACLEDASVELFEHYGVDILSKEQVEPRSTPTVELVAVISAASDLLKIGIILRVEQELLEEVFPIGQGEKTSERLCDWMGEMCNQLMGRLKNKLLLYDVSVQQHIPAVLQAKEIEVILPKSVRIKEFSLCTDVGDVSITWTLGMSEGLNMTLLGHPPINNNPAHEGEFIFL